MDAINQGRSPIDEPGVADLLARAHSAGRLRASTSTREVARDADVIVVIVPALLTADHDADVSILQSVARQLAPSLKKGAMVSFETTLPVGGTRRYLLPLLEEGGRKAGVDFDLVFSPERVKSHAVLRNLTVNPKVVGGLTPESGARAQDFYARYLGASVFDVGSLESAEFVKLAGMIYRDVNIALANELARYAEATGLNLPSLLEPINSDGEAALLSPGIGVGGHCTPVYPHFLIRDAHRRGVHARLAEESRRINDGQAAHTLDRLEQTWGRVAGRRALVLGLAFRPSVKEHTLSTSITLVRELKERGAIVQVHDPLYPDDELRAFGFVPGSLASPRAPDVLVLSTSHPEYRNLPFPALREGGLQAVVDGRNLWDGGELARLGLTYVGVGRSAQPAASGRGNGARDGSAERSDT